MSYISRPADEPDRHPTWDVPKHRRCLRCETIFKSGWSGERICPRCKRSHSWRNNLPMPLNPLYRKS